MKQSSKLALGVFLSVSLVAAAHAPAQGPGGGRQQGITNSKKAALAKQARDKKVLAVKKQAYALRQQAQGAK